MTTPTDLPVVERPMPLTLRCLLIAIGLAVMVWPAWDLRHGVWPLNGLSMLFGGIALGAMFVGAVFVLGGLAGEGQRWRYAPGALLVERRLWRRTWSTRLTAADIAAIEVRHEQNSEGPDGWRVVVVPRPAPDVTSGPRTRRMGAGFESADFRSPADAQAAAEALRRHLGMAA